MDTPFKKKPSENHTLWDPIESPPHQVNIDDSTFLLFTGVNNSVGFSLLADVTLYKKVVFNNVE